MILMQLKQRRRLNSVTTGKHETKPQNHLCRFHPAPEVPTPSENFLQPGASRVVMQTKMVFGAQKHERKPQRLHFEHLFRRGGSLTIVWGWSFVAHWSDSGRLPDLFVKLLFCL